MDFSQISGRRLVITALFVLLTILSFFQYSGNLIG